MFKNAVTFGKIAGHSRGHRREHNFARQAPDPQGASFCTSFDSPLEPLHRTSVRELREHWGEQVLLGGDDEDLEDLSPMLNRLTGPGAL